MAEYKPNFKMWLFSVFLAAGFGNAAADGVSYLISTSLEKEGALSFVDKGCWNRDSKNSAGQTIIIPTCEFFFENIGDKAAVVTHAKIDSLVYRSFYTNNPGGFRRIVTNFTNANVAITSAKEFLVIQVPVKPDQWSETLCLFNKDVELICS